jgi:putative zinc finger protein
MSQVDRYTCEEVLRRLDDYIDRQLSVREMELAREHMETCAACAREYGFSAHTLSTIKTKLRRIDVASDLIDRIALVLAEAHAQEQDPNGRSHS